MKILYITIVVITICSYGRSAVAQQPIERSARTTEELLLTTDIVERRYCVGGGMLLTLQFILKNSGSRDLIIFRYANAPHKWKYSRSSKDLRAGRYEHVISPMMGSSGSAKDLGDSPPTEFFVILKPGQSHIAPNTVIVAAFISKNDTRKAKDYLIPGQHLLQVVVDNWPYAYWDAERYQKRWQSTGHLWIDPVVSQPIPFQIEPYTKRTLSNCNSGTKK